jgi:hypothetical protein
MQDDKAQAWFTLADHDAIEKKIAATFGKTFMDYNGYSMNNMEQFGRRMLENYTIQSQLKSMMVPLIDQMIGDGLQRNLRIDHFTDHHMHHLRYRVSYKGTVIIEQEVNLRGY